MFGGDDTASASSPFRFRFSFSFSNLSMAALQACAGALQAFCLGLAVYIALFRHSTHETPLLYVPHLVAVACVVLIVLSPALLDPSSSSMALLESVCRAAAAAVVTRIAHRSFIEGRPGYRREGVDLAGKIVIVTVRFGYLHSGKGWKWYLAFQDRFPTDILLCVLLNCC